MGNDEPTITLDEDGDVVLDLVDVATGRGFITGKSGFGKSNSASVIVEETLDQNAPAVIIDTDGEYWGLKKEYEILHVGGDDEADYRVGPEHAEWLAQKAVRGGIPIILDVSGYIESETADEMVREMLFHLFQEEKTAKTPLLVVVEEMHEFIPQKGGKTPAGEMMLRVGKRGRKHGLGLCGISQRPAAVDKDFITQADWVLWHRLTWENDTDVVGDVVSKDAAETVAQLDVGEALLVADFRDEHVETVHVRKKKTFDAGETPGFDDYEPPELKGLSDDLTAELEDIAQSERQRRDEIDRLESIIEQKEKEIETLQRELDHEKTATATLERITDRIAAGAGGDSDEVQAQIDEIRKEKNEEIEDLRHQRDHFEEQVAEVEADRQELEDQVEELKERAQVSANIDELREAVSRMNDALGLDVEGGDEKLRERLSSKEERIEELQNRLEQTRRPDGEGVGPLDDYVDFYDDDDVEAIVEETCETTDAYPKIVRGVMWSLKEESRGLSYEDIAEIMGLNDTSDVIKAANDLHELSVVTKERVDGRIIVDYNFEGVNEMKEAKRRRERFEAEIQGD